MLTIQSNTPLRHPPANYCPSGSDQWFKLPEGLDAGKTLFYSDSVTGDGDAHYTVLFVHGNPENSYTYRHVRDHLIASDESLRLVAPDHIGFGLSDQADFEMVEMHHADNLLQLVRYLDLQNIILVVHDWGGPIGIGALLQDPERVSGLCVLNTSVFPMPSEGPNFTNYPSKLMAWHLTPSRIPDFLWGGVASAIVPSDFDPEDIGAFLPAVVGSLWRYGRGKIGPDHADYVWSEQFSSKANTRSSKQLVSQTASWGEGLPYTDKKHGLQDNRAFYRDLQDRISAAWGAGGQNIHCVAHFGLWDALAKPSVIAQWHSALPQLRECTELYTETGHFVEEVKGQEIAQSILKIVSELRA